jgi:hypothetical protein
MARKKTKKKIPSKRKKTAPKKKSAKKKPARNTAPKKVASRGRARGKAEVTSPLEFEPKGLGARSGGQSGDLQGLSNRGGSDSESVDELLEEGNAFEAEAVKGVEDADEADEQEVRTHEVPEDDVPEEYEGDDPQS